IEPFDYSVSEKFCESKIKAHETSRKIIMDSLSKIEEGKRHIIICVELPRRSLSSNRQPPILSYDVYGNLVVIIDERNLKVILGDEGAQYILNAIYTKNGWSSIE